MLSIILFLFLFVAIPQDAHAQIRITEIYPVPASGASEWVELFNSSTQNQALSQFKLKDLANHPIALPGLNVAPQGYIIATASGILNNSGDTLVLTFADGTVLDQVTYQDTLLSTQSLNLCGEEWVISELLSPGFENIACLTDEPDSYITQLTASPSQITTSITPSSSQIEISGLATAPDATHPTALPTLQSYTQKFVLGATHTTTISPTAIPTRTHIVVPPPVHEPQPLVLILIVIGCAGILGVTGYFGYSLVKKIKQTYNETYVDT